MTETASRQYQTQQIMTASPAMLVFMAIIVCVMLMSMYLPMIQAYGNARGF